MEVWCEATYGWACGHSVPMKGNETIGIMKDAGVLCRCPVCGYDPHNLPLNFKFIDMEEVE